MEKIRFTNTERKFAFKIEKMPTILLDSVIFNTTDSNWALKLSNLSINFSISGFNKENKIISSLFSPFSPIVSPYQTQPVIILNQLPVQFNMRELFIDLNKCEYLEVNIELTNINLASNETITLQYNLVNQTEYNLLCKGVLNSIIYISDNHPNYPNKRIVTSVPVIVTEVQNRGTELEFGSHSIELYDNNVNDDFIIQEIKEKYDILCDEINEQIIKK